MSIPSPAPRRQLRIVVDVDGTLTHHEADRSYAEKRPRVDVIDQVRRIRESGAYVILYSSRNMRTYAGDLNLIRRYTLPVLSEWLERHNVPYDELHIGKPWCGVGGIYVSARSMRPAKFAALSLEELQRILASTSPVDELI